MIVLDTSVLVDALTGPRRSAAAMRRAIERGERLVLATLVLYEWLRGPRSPAEVAAQEALFPAETAIPFGREEATVAARLHRDAPRARGREFDLALAACAITHQAAVWTLNPRDFRGIPGVVLFAAEAR